MTASGNDADLARRTFLARAAAGAGLVACGAVLGTRPSAIAGEARPERVPPRFGLLIDTDRCASGCDRCVSACNQEHGLGDGEANATDPQWIRPLRVRRHTTEQVETLPLMCQHCDDAPCVHVCPTGASFKRADGVVLVDRHTCIGCRYCVVACPFQARAFVHENLSRQKPHAPRGKGTAEGCTLCVHRIDEREGRTSACAEACADAGHHAIVFGDLNDPQGAIASRLVGSPGHELRDDLSLNTGVRYQGASWMTRRGPT